ncbi:MAG TPA: hypothetical protein VL475_05310 [Planctomycetaceae bacterium]|nr:hypothetical protein [Planctomycetaceae bacterium]
MSFELFFQKGRTSSEVVTLYEANGNGLTLYSGDKVRFKVYRRDAATPVLDIDSVGALSGGSLVTVDQIASAAQVTLKMCQGDTSGLTAGAYDAELTVVDSGDSNLIKTVETGLVHFLPSPGGDIGLT